MKPYGSLLVGALLLSLASCQTSEVECECQSPAVDVSAIGPTGQPVALDSLHAFFGGKPLSGTVDANLSSTTLSVGTTTGQYKLVAFYKGQKSDTVTVDVKRTDASSCRSISTQLVKFEFNAPNPPTATIKDLGVCSHTTL
jgi:hypothetical protein